MGKITPFSKKKKGGIGGFLTDLNPLGLKRTKSSIQKLSRPGLIFN
jgi:hypothetical protein